MTAPQRMPVLIRAVIALAGCGLVFVPAPVHLFAAAITSVGVLLAVAAPARVGSSVASAGFLVAWLAVTGWQGAPSVGATIAGAALLYVVHVATALAAQVPLTSTVQASVVRRFARRCAVPLAGAAVFSAIDLALPGASGSPLIELAGLLGLLLLAGAVGALFWSRPAAAADQPGGHVSANNT